MKTESYHLPFIAVMFFLVMTIFDVSENFACYVFTKFELISYFVSSFQLNNLNRYFIISFFLYKTETYHLPLLSCFFWIGDDHFQWIRRRCPFVIQAYNHIFNSFLDLENFLLCLLRFHKFFSWFDFLIWWCQDSVTQLTWCMYQVRAS